MKLNLLTAAIAFSATSAMSQQIHHSGPIAETGQSQFAAIAEIVALLRDDPETDWRRTDIDALRDHLMDMDNVTTQASVATTAGPLDVTFLVSGDGAVVASIRNLVSAHSPMLQQATGWLVMAEETAEGVTMQIRAESQADIDQITGLGFFGVMTVGAHHQQHHLMIASGFSPH